MLLAICMLGTALLGIVAVGFVLGFACGLLKTIINWIRS